MLNGFKQYFESKAQYVPHDNGLQELTRLEKGHFLVALPVDHDTAWKYLNGSDGLQYISKDMIVSAYDIEKMARTTKEAVMILSIPRRWFSRPQLEVKGITGAIGELLPLGEGWKLPANYVWGYFSKWNENHETNVEPGQFYRNLGYHANDGLYEKWKQTYQKDQGKQPLKLDTPTPRVTAPHTTHGNHRAFHGYNDVSFE